jgi:predicted ATP-grasp superfamily ATP-dependent carboligase
MKILVYEHMSSGGYAGQSISDSLLSEGFGMLRTVTSDFKAVGHEITVLLDERISKLNPPINADWIVPIFNPQEAKNFLSKIAKINDAVLVVAPETGQILQSLVELVERTDKISLNCESRSTSKVADKTVLYQILRKNHLPIPETASLRVNDDLAKIKLAIKTNFCYPLIFKPVDGVSCSGLSIVNAEAEVEKAIEKIKTESAEEHFVAQEFVKGETASVSLICAKGKASAISLNQQIIKAVAPDNTSSYEGGLVPFDHPLKTEAFTVAEKAIRGIEGLRGYVGIDLILAKDKVFVVDVNPRLTTSYVGLSRVANFNVAEALVNAILKGELPVNPETNGYVSFSKLKIPKPTIKVFNTTSQIREVISPPFPLNDFQKACALIAGQGDSMEKARLQLEEAKKHVLNIISRGK